MKGTWLLPILVLLLALLPSAAQAAVKGFWGAETQSLSGLCSTGGSTTIDTIDRRTGAASYKMVQSTPGSTYLGFSCDTSNPIYVRAYIKIVVSTNPSSATSGVIMFIDGASGACRLIGTYNTDGTVTGVIKINNETVQVGGSFSIPTKQWVRVELYCKSNASTGETTGKINGVTVATGTGLDTGGNTITAHGIGGPPNSNSLAATMWVDDLLIDDAAFPGDGRVILRKTRAGIPTTGISQAPMGLVGDPTTGADFIRASDTVIAARVALVAKIGAGTASTYSIRRRVNGVDTDTAFSPTTSDAHHDGDTFTPALADFATMEIGVTRGATGTAELRVEHAYIHIAYRPSYTAALPVKWDTAWRLPLASRAVIADYIARRKTDGFDAMYVMASDYGLNNRQALGNGQTPFLASKGTGGGCAVDVGDITQPSDGAFDQVDYIVDQLNARDMYAALLPMSNGDTTCYTWALRDTGTENRAYRYGRYVGARYKNKANVIWVLGGDTSYAQYQPDTEILTKNFLGGLRDAGALQPVTWHVGTRLASVNSIGYSASDWLPFDGQWLDFNTGQVYNSVTGGFKAAVRAVDKTKQGGIGEMSYEAADTALHLRQNYYNNFLAGLQYGGYGNATRGSDSCCSVTVGTTWDSSFSSTATGTSGAQHFVIAANKMIERGWLTYSTSETFISSCTGRCTGMIKSNTNGMVYLETAGSSATLNMASFNGNGTVRVTRMDPATGTVTTVGDFSTSGSQAFGTSGLADALIMVDPLGAAPSARHHRATPARRTPASRSR